MLSSINGYNEPTGAPALFLKRHKIDLDVNEFCQFLFRFVPLNDTDRFTFELTDTSLSLGRLHTNNAVFHDEDPDDFYKVTISPADLHGVPLDKNLLEQRQVFSHEEWMTIDKLPSFLDLVQNSPLCRFARLIIAKERWSSPGFTVQYWITDTRHFPRNYHFIVQYEQY